MRFQARVVCRACDYPQHEGECPMILCILDSQAAQQGKIAWCQSRLNAGRRFVLSGMRARFSRPAASQVGKPHAEIRFYPCAAGRCSGA